MTWRHLSNLPAAVFSFRYVIKGPSKSPLKSYFSFCACDFRGDHIRWKISANAALTCEEGRESIGNCGSFFGRRRNFTRIFQASLVVAKSRY